ncbi:RNA polymerase sigma factor [Aeromicrobium endophyticum]|uniref:Sigma-70 family RNA polymerase sigma factor n=1 Tax=Aeromicrobium endophyticum TaxID=2292704 RepID=A0A371PB73_9ACTN|nr:sigma-70 family RNA polymerase sigma factor [Aeromicrobium endophyticum]REK73173.1 sigma-70 family RNA polymerase sigma factor [Aeromicrobium endophyticum]
MDSTVAAQHREQRFRTLYDDVHGDLLRFVLRRVHPRHAEDVVSEAMLVAWRRLDDVPIELSSARAWLFGVARHILLNTGRREHKEQALPVRLAEAVPPVTHGGQSADLVATQVDIARAWEALSPIHQEALALRVFEGLSAPEAALTLDISPTAFRLRLSRARRALARLIESGNGDGPIPGGTTYARSPQ